MEVLDRVLWNAKWRIDKFRDPTGVIGRLLNAGVSIEHVKAVFPHAFIGAETWSGNVALNVGLQKLIELACGISTPTKWDNSNARLGVGSDATAPSATQTDLQDASPTWKAMDATYPQRTTQVAEWRSTFADGEAEESWEEYAVDNGATEHILLNRCTASKGTKSTGESWTLSLKITFS